MSTKKMVYDETITQSFDRFDRIREYRIHKNVILGELARQVAEATPGGLELPYHYSSPDIEGDYLVLIIKNRAAVDDRDVPVVATMVRDRHREAGMMHDDENDD